jgi:alanine dehydrogenase
MSEIAGRMRVLGRWLFPGETFWWHGVLLGGVGVLPGKVVVLGGGASGINAARMAQGLGADVTILEVDLERMRFLDITLHTAHTLYSSEAHLMDLLPEVDLLIGAVLVPGARAPKLINREMLARMRPGSVLVDIAIDQGGCAEASRATTHQAPVYVEKASPTIAWRTCPALRAHRHAGVDERDVSLRETLSDYGLTEACHKQPSLLGGINVMGGKVTHCRGRGARMDWAAPMV